MEKKLQDFDVLMVRGYVPNKRILRYAKESMELIVSIPSYFDKNVGYINYDELDRNCVLRFLDENDIHINKITIDEGFRLKKIHKEFDNYYEFIEFMCKEIYD